MKRMKRRWRNLVERSSFSHDICHPYLQYKICIAVHKIVLNICPIECFFRFCQLATHAHAHCATKHIQVNEGEKSRQNKRKWLYFILFKPHEIKSYAMHMSSQQINDVIWMNTWINSLWFKGSLDNVAQTQTMQTLRYNIYNTDKMDDFFVVVVINFEKKIFFG